MNLTNRHHKIQYVTFRLADNLMGIDILDAREILPYMKMTTVQQAPDFILGLMNLRGRILTIFDIGILLGLEKRPLTLESHIIVFKHKDVGFVVDQIGDVMGIDQKEFESIPANVQLGVQYFMDHMINLPREILMILNAQKLLSYAKANHEMIRKSL